MGRTTDDIDGLPGEGQQIVELFECIDNISTARGMEISAERTELMTNTKEGINTEIKVNAQRPEKSESDVQESIFMSLGFRFLLMVSWTRRRGRPHRSVTRRQLRVENLL